MNNEKNLKEKVIDLFNNIWSEFSHRLKRLSLAKREEYTAFMYYLSVIDY